MAGRDQSPLVGGNDAGSWCLHRRSDAPSIVVVQVARQRPKMPRVGRCSGLMRSHLVRPTAELTRVDPQIRMQAWVLTFAGRTPSAWCSLVHRGGYGAVGVPSQSWYPL
jgi:hypothetical protein